MGMDWSLREGYAWPEDKEHCEEYGRMLNANPAVVSARAKKRGLPQLGTLGAGNHYAEIQVVDEIFDKFAAGRMGIDMIGQVKLFKSQFFIPPERSEGGGRNSHSVRGKMGVMSRVRLSPLSPQTPLVLEG